MGVLIMQPDTLQASKNLPTLMAIWQRNKPECCGIGSILRNARSGLLPGVRRTTADDTLIVVDETAALAAMRAD